MPCLAHFSHLLILLCVTDAKWELNRDSALQKETQQRSISLKNVGHLGPSSLPSRPHSCCAGSLRDECGDAQHKAWPQGPRAPRAASAVPSRSVCPSQQSPRHLKSSPGLSSHTSPLSCPTCQPPQADTSTRLAAPDSTPHTEPASALTVLPLPRGQPPTPGPSCLL